MESRPRQSEFPTNGSPDRLLGDLPAEEAKAFNALKAVGSYARGTTLFREGHPARGVFVLCDGRARLSVCSESGKRLTLRIAGPGEVLGLSASLTAGTYGATAELLDHARVAVIKRKDLIRFLREHREACLQVVHLLSEDLHTAYDCVRSVGLGRSRRARPPRVH